MLPRNEYPRPQFARDGWMTLNGRWQFEIDFGASGKERKFYERDDFEKEITVPFCPESRLSGIGYTDFMPAVWYRRTFTLPKKAAGKRVFLCFGAVDYECEAWVNSVSAGTHFGGYVGFEFDITKLLREGENTLVVCATDDLRGGRQPFGKQCSEYYSKGCSYTRTTGIWQSVWLEWTGESYIRSIRLTPDAFNGSVAIEAELTGDVKGATLSAAAFFEGEYQAEIEADADGGSVRMNLLIEKPVLWEAGKGNLYDLTLTLKKGRKVFDTVNTYFGLRSVRLVNGICELNGKRVFQRLILDQGFYPDGIYTAPTDDELKNDILRSMAMGFNGARLHQKVFEPRFLYWADKLGYLCWGEMASWGASPAHHESADNFLHEWMQVLARDYSHPCIVGWCPWNETWYESNCGKREMTQRLSYEVTKLFDPTRPCIDTSGGLHVITDIFDTHDYEQNVDVYKERYAPGQPLYDRFDGKQHYSGEPMFVSEYGGIRWNPDGEGWGYGNGPKTEEEFIERYRGLTSALLANPEHLGFCYTQLTDVEQERNGLYYYDRRPKFDPALIHDITAAKAACEEE